jgi:hypothetical protein
MKIDRRVTNGLAWAGLFVVVGVPAADLLSAQFLGEPERVAVVSPQTPLEPEPAATPVKETVASAPPAAPQPRPAPAPRPQTVAAAPGGKAADPVDSFLQSGKKLPSYITGPDAPEPVAAARPAPAAPPAAPAPVAAAKPAPAAPPVAPAGVSVAAPASTQAPAAPVVGVPPAPVGPTLGPVDVAALPPTKVAPVPMPLSMRPRPQQVPVASVTRREEPVVIPPEVVFGERGSIGAEDLEDWESGPLSEFLSQRQARSGSDADFEQEYYPEEPVRPRRDRLIGPANEEFFVPFR